MEGHFFPSEYPAVPAPFVENATISPTNYLGIFVGNQLTTYARVYSWTLFCLIDRDMSIFMPVPHCLDYLYSKSSNRVV